MTGPQRYAGYSPPPNAARHDKLEREVEDREREVAIRERQLRQAQRQIDQLQHQVTSLQRVARSAVTLLAPYADSRAKPR
jgi:chromosome segregation ATPase